MWRIHIINFQTVIAQFSKEHYGDRHHRRYKRTNADAVYCMALQVARITDLRDVPQEQNCDSVIVAAKSPRPNSNDTLF